MRYLISLFFIILLLFSYVRPVLAESDYVLPYPSSLPGSKVYRVHLLWEKISNYWYFGRLGQFKYNLRYSDKYLVEAKTLLEYKQYLLGYSALQKSNIYFQNLLNAQKKNNNTVHQQKLLKSAALKHVEELSLIKERVPKDFVWQAEKSSPAILDIHKIIDESKRIRKVAL